jgi:hypothetical protein
MLRLEHAALVMCLASIILMQRGRWIESICFSVASSLYSIVGHRQRALSERED